MTIEWCTLTAVHPTHGSKKGQKREPHPLTQSIVLAKAVEYYRYCGLSRPALNVVVLPGTADDNCPRGRSKIFAQPGRKRGVRLINDLNLVSFIGGLLDKGGNALGRPASSQRCESERPPVRADRHSTFHDA